MMNVKKYQKQYYMPPVPCMDWAEKDSIDNRRTLAAGSGAGAGRHRPDEEIHPRTCLPR